MWSCIVMVMTTNKVLWTNNNVEVSKFYLNIVSRAQQTNLEPVPLHNVNNPESGKKKYWTSFFSSLSFLKDHMKIN